MCPKVMTKDDDEEGGQEVPVGGGGEDDGGRGGLHAVMPQHPTLPPLPHLGPVKTQLIHRTNLKYK